MAKSNFYHFTGHKAAVNADEVVPLSKFIFTLTLPKILQQKYGTTEMITQQIKKVGGYEADKFVGIIEQEFAGVKRVFLGTNPEDGDIVTLDLEFNVNVNKSNVMYPYNILRDWSKLGYDGQTGLGVLKRDYIGQVTLEVHDKVGTVLKKFFAPMATPGSAPGAFELDYSKGTEIYSIGSYKVICEGWTDTLRTV